MKRLSQMPVDYGAYIKVLYVWVSKGCTHFLLSYIRMKKLKRSNPNLGMSDVGRHMGWMRTVLLQ